MVASLAAAATLGLAPTAAGEGGDPDWMIWLEDLGFCPMMDCDPEPPPRIQVEPVRLAGVTISGSIGAAMIRQSVRQQSSRVRACYERQLLLDPELAGRVTVRFVISPEGEVIHSQVAQSDVGNQALESCVAQVISEVLFPSAEDRGYAVVTYPFLFRRSAGGGDQRAGATF